MESANLGDFVYFRLIDHYVREQMTHAMLGLMARAMAWAGSIALVLVTLWVMVQGYRIVTGRSRQPMIRLAVDMARIAVIVSAATTMAIGSTHLYDWLTQGLDQEIHGVFTGDRSDTTAEAIDRHLAYTQIAISAIDIVQVPPADHELLAAKSRATLIANFGIASPPMTAAAMSLLYQLALLLWLALAPPFILSLLFEQTKDLFRRWLMYGIGTMFAMAALSAVSAIALEMNLRVAIALWGAKVINGMRGADAEGLSNLALQQGGLGLLLIVLIISVPPMVAKFFRGTLANFMPFSAFGQGMTAVRQWGPGRAVPIELGVVPSGNTYIRAPNRDQSQLDEIKTGEGIGVVGRGEAEREAVMADAARGDPRYWTAQVGVPAAGTGTAIARKTPSSWKFPSAAHVGDSGSSYGSLARGASIRAFVTGLGKEVDELAALSPTMQEQLKELHRRGLFILYGDTGPSNADMNRKPPTIWIDPAYKGRPEAIVSQLSHELGHAKNPLTDDFSSKDAFLKMRLENEGYATLNNLSILEEIASNGGPTINPATSNADNIARYKVILGESQITGDTGAAIDAIATIYGASERTSDSQGHLIRYNKLYGDWYEKNYKH